MNLGLKNKVVFVTGASSGIGRACAEQFGKEFAYVIVGYRNNKEIADQVVENIKDNGGDGFAVRLDLSDLNSLDACVKEIEGRVGKIHSLILNAGENSLTPFDAIEEDEWDALLSSNLKGPYFLLKKMIPLFANSASAVFVASIAGQTGAPGHAHYAAAKAGTINLSKSAAKFFASRVRVNCVSPGLTMTRMGEEAIKGANPEYLQKKLLSRRAATPGEIANVVVFMASPAASFVYGATIDVNGGRELR
ncbi:SDR family NAD(P)-dependent oxidoreductase [Uliginosibacterium sp. 31-12]|uniref:SDR family NAD(P)-dependent oxidoreductase n=1 Tax=Uliginosibacterium sp. 31-12 TaxID=3062781 RepID=UPI0026E1422E|nr:SDR family oxidoreductase [Uliginosibacterium sp. 31-12]MDO6384984.1 SDR family oxidoreductase [Uliginosibacterium sp. 31-12]